MSRTYLPCFDIPLTLGALITVLAAHATYTSITCRALDNIFIILMLWVMVAFCWYMAYTNAVIERLTSQRNAEAERLKAE